jgi:toxin YhaV
VAAKSKPIVPAVPNVNGWTILLHPLFLDQVAATVADVQRAKAKDEVAYKGKNCTKRLAAILKLAFEVIPQDPAADVYRQGNTLGKDFTHWRRAKFFQQYRLYFRYDDASKVIIYAWVNDETTKRAYGSRTDAYAVFSGMLGRGRPPDDWAALRKECDAEEARRAKAAEPSVPDEIGGVQKV